MANTPSENYFTGGYIFTKAERYLKIGADNYRNKDFFHQPPENLSRELLEKLEDGCRQFTMERGYSKDNPLENIEIDGFYCLMDLFHFKVIEQGIAVIDEDYYIDKMVAQHIMSGDKMILYNKVEHSK
jgi:hypothetical protein